MRKLIIALTLLSAAAFSHAGNSMCDAKYSQAERMQCYNYAVNGGLTRMKENYRRIKNSAKVPENEKTYIDTNHQEWAKYVDSTCRDNVCYYSEISKRNNEIEGYMSKFKLTPM